MFHEHDNFVRTAKWSLQRSPGDSAEVLLRLMKNAMFGHLSQNLAISIADRCQNITQGIAKLRYRRRLDFTTPVFLTVENRHRCPNTVLKRESRDATSERHFSETDGLTGLLFWEQGHSILIAVFWRDAGHVVFSHAFLSVKKSDLFGIRGRGFGIGVKTALDIFHVNMAANIFQVINQEADRLNEVSPNYDILMKDHQLNTASEILFAANILSMMSLDNVDYKETASFSVLHAKES